MQLWAWHLNDKSSIIQQGVQWLLAAKENRVLIVQVPVKQTPTANFAYCQLSQVPNTDIHR